MKKTFLLIGIIGAMFCSCEKEDGITAQNPSMESCESKLVSIDLGCEYIYFYYNGKLEIKEAITYYDDAIVEMCKTHIDTTHNYGKSITPSGKYFRMIKKGDYTDKDTISYDKDGKLYY